MTRWIKFCVLASALSVMAPVMGAELSVNINDDTIKTMAEHLEGVGLRRAAAIADYRNDNGPFKSVDELARVKGISERLVEKNRERIVLSEPEE